MKLAAGDNWGCAALEFCVDRLVGLRTSDALTNTHPCGQASSICTCDKACSAASCTRSSPHLSAACLQGEAPGGAGAIKVPENIFTMVCEKCKGGHYEDQIILCDRCDKGWHMFCLSPPLEIVPEGDWICPSCVATGECRRWRVSPRRQPLSSDGGHACCTTLTASHPAMPLPSGRSILVARHC